MSLDALFNPRSVAVIGASADPNRIGGRPIDFSKKGGFAPPIYPVNPNQSEIQGLRAYPSLQVIPYDVDLAVIALPAAAVPDAIEAGIAKGVRAIMLFSAGFAEIDDAGKAVQDAIRQRCAAAGIRLLGPNCLGVMNIATGLICTFSTVLDNIWPRRGRVSVVSQSGAFGAYAFGLAAERGIGFGKWIATGNEADVDVAECIAWLADDPDTGVIMAYIEGCRDGMKLRQALARARANRKPVIVMKAGATEAGATAVASHTGSLAGQDAVWDAVFREGGAHRAQTMDEYVDLAYACANDLFPEGPKLGIVTVSGGVGVLLADAGSRFGLEMPALPPAAQARIRDIIPFASPTNPVDVTAQIINVFHEFGNFLGIMFESGGFHSVIIFLQQMGKTPRHYDLFKGPLLEARKRYRQQLLVLCGGYSVESRAEMESHGFLIFEDPARAVAAVAGLVGFARRFAEPQKPPPVSTPSTALTGVQGNRGALDEAQSKRLLAAAGVPFLPERVARTRDEAVAAAGTLGFPVVLKVLSADIAHKSDAGGVELGLADAGAVASAWNRMMAAVSAAAPSARVEGALVAPMIHGGVETVLGLLKDPVFGPVLMFGLGGVFVEIFRDVTFRLAPIDHDEAHAMIREIKGFPLLDGARGRPAVDLDRLAGVIVALGAFGAAHADQLISVDINPFIALPDGGVAVDALVVT